MNEEKECISYKNSSYLFVMINGVPLRMQHPVNLRNLNEIMAKKCVVQNVNTHTNFGSDPLFRFFA